MSTPGWAVTWYHIISSISTHQKVVKPKCFVAVQMSFYFLFTRKILIIMCCEVTYLIKGIHPHTILLELKTLMKHGFSFWWLKLMLLFDQEIRSDSYLLDPWVAMVRVMRSRQQTDETALYDFTAWDENLFMTRSRKWWKKWRVNVDFSHCDSPPLSRRWTLTSPSPCCSVSLRTSSTTSSSTRRPSARAPWSRCATWPPSPCPPTPPPFTAPANPSTLCWGRRTSWTAGERAATAPSASRWEGGKNMRETKRKPSRLNDRNKACNNQFLRSIILKCHSKHKRLSFYWQNSTLELNQELKDWPGFMYSSQANRQVIKIRRITSNTSE